MSHMQIARLCSDKDRRSLFRAWSRLCLHAASLNAAEASSATVTAAARAARAEAEKKGAVAAAAAANISTSATVLQKRAEAAEQAVREEQEKRAMQMVGWFSSAYLMIAVSSDTRLRVPDTLQLKVETGVCLREALHEHTMANIAPTLPTPYSTTIRGVLLIISPRTTDKAMRRASAISPHAQLGFRRIFLLTYTISRHHRANALLALRHPPYNSTR